MKCHDEKIQELQIQMRDLLKQKKAENDSNCIALKYASKESFTMRTKSYKNQCHTLHCGSLNDVIKVDVEKRVVIVEPRVTMEELVLATLPYGLTVPVVPEFKAITVGGAIMGMAGESASHRWGCFNDACLAFEILLGDGSLLRATPNENQDIFYGICGSYGSLGPLVSAEIQLIPAKEYIHLKYTTFTTPSDSINYLRNLSLNPNSPDFLDGIVFEKNLAVIIEGNFISEKKSPLFSMKSTTSKYYFEHVKEIALESTHYEEIMSTTDYYFRYDLCAFWMGRYLFHPSFIIPYTVEGILQIENPKKKSFSKKEINKLNNSKTSNLFTRTLLSPFMSSKNLCKILHKAEKWIQNRFIIQDFCIPESKASKFLSEAIDDTALFPVWLLPIKGTNKPQIFAPHLLTKDMTESHFINIGLYGLPGYSSPIGEITKKLEKKAYALKGRKVLYSHSYYSQEEFWNIYSLADYTRLREKNFANGVFQEITDKVLSDNPSL